MSRTLALDLGTVRIGVALSCPLGMIAQPLVVIMRKKVDGLAKVVSLVAEHEVSTLVLGRPTTLRGEDGPAVVAAEKFAQALKERITIPLVWWDERLSTRAAERSLLDVGMRRDQRKSRIDMVAATLILQGYLDACGRRPFNGI